MVALPLERRAIWLRQDGRHFLGIEIDRRMHRRPLGGNAQHASALRHQSRLSPGREAEETAQRGQAAIARADRVVTLFFGMEQESGDLHRRQVVERKLGHGPALSLGDEPEKQAPRVAVGTNGVGRGVALLDHPFAEERAQQFGQGIDPPHDRPPSAAFR